MVHVDKHYLISEELKKRMRKPGNGLNGSPSPSII
jgi:hypothetical protein